MLIDLSKKRVALTRERIPVAAFDPLGGNAPRLGLTWSSNSRLRVLGGPESMLVVDVEKGVDLDLAGEEVWEGAEGRPRISTPGLPDRFGYSRHEDGPRGCFELRFGQVFYRGEKEAAASVLDERGVQVADLAVDPAGEWAVFTSLGNTYLVAGRTKTKSILLAGGSYDLEWLPSAE